MFTLLTTGALAAALLVAPRADDCEPAADGGDGLGTLEGTVLDARATTPVPHALVTVRWRAIVMDDRSLRTERHEAKARADSAGHYVVCGVPAGVPVLAWASAGESRSVPAEIEVPADGALALDLRVPRVAATGAIAVAARPVDTLATLEGRVRDAAGVAVPGARIRVGAHETRTDADGRFALAGLAAGEHRLEVASIGWTPAEAWVTVASGERARVEVAVDQRVAVLDTVRTTAAALEAIPGLAARRRAGLGRFVDRAEIARRNATLPSELLAGLGAVARAGHDEDTGFTSARRSARCEPTVFLDGTPLLGAVSLDRHVTTGRIAAIEVYASEASVPAAFRARSGCGAVLVWTRPGNATTRRR